MAEAEGSKFRNNIALTTAALLLLASYCIPAGIQSALFFLCCGSILFFRRRPLSLYIIKATWPLFLILLLGTAGGVAHDRLGKTFPGLYEALKDGWYMAKGILAFWTGCLLMESIERKNDIWKSILWAAVLVAATYVAIFSKETITTGFSSVNMIRGEVGHRPTIFIGFALAAVLTHPALIKRPRIRIAVLALLTPCVITAFSRTLWVCVIIMLLSMAGLFSRLKWKTVFKVLTFAFAASLIILVAIKVFSLEKIWSDMTLKIQHIFSETTFQIDRVSGASDERVRKQWRGFEARRAWEEYAQGDWQELLAGQGYGAVVDVGFEMPLTQRKFRYLPVLHNGYLTLLFKTGAFGLLLFLFFLMRILTRAGDLSRRKEKELSETGKNLLAIALGLGLSTLVTGGFLNKSYHSLTLLLGVFYSYARYLLMTVRQQMTRGCVV